MKQCNVIRLGRVHYDEALSFQFELVERLRDKKGKDSFLILLEHHPVITIGKNGNKGNILVSEETLKRKGIQLRKIDRGGDVTYHGPGQLVGYPILSLNYHKKTVKQYVHLLEDCAIRTLDSFGVKAENDSKYIGVWVNGEKIGFIGVRISRGITYHGFSLNINPDLNAFNLINPCGIRDRKVTSLTNLLDKKVVMADVIKEFTKNFSALFNVKTVSVKTHLSYIPKILDNL